jgi:cbb3-type cytochrome oxidase subunit 3
MFEHATAAAAPTAWLDLFFCTQLYFAWSKHKHQHGRHH